MGKYQVTTEDGIYEVETEDSASVDSTIPNLGNTEDKIALREDMLPTAIEGAKNQNLLISNPIETGKNALGLLGGVSQRAEATVANPLLDIQRGDYSKIVDSMIKGAKGERLGQLGDLVRTTGFGGPWNEALASTTGFMAALSIDTILNKGKITSAKSKIISSTDQAVRDAVINKTGFLDDVRNAFYDAKSSAVEKYGVGLDELAKNNPLTKVNLRPVIDQLSHEIAFEPKLRNAIDRVPYLKNIFANPKLADSVDIKEAQSLVNDLQSKISSGKLKGVGVRPDDIPLLDAIHDIKSQMVKAFPDIAEMRKDYGDVINKFNLVRNKLKVGSLEKQVQSKFGDVELQKVTKELLSDSPEIISRMKNYNLIRKVGKMAAIGVEGVAGAVLIKKFLNS